MGGGSDASDRGDGPPRPRFALSVGVIGHRPDRLPDEHHLDELAKVVRDVRDVLAAIAAAARDASADDVVLYAADDPTLPLVSALAEGADTIAAKEALKAHYKLDAPLPFPVHVYLKDFCHTPEKPSDPADVLKADARSKLATDDFSGLLSRARSVLELPGSRQLEGDETRAYEAAGLTVLSQADIVLAVWDRGPPKGRGGTPALISEAARAGLPIVVVDAKGNRAPELLWRNLMNLSAPLVAVEDLPAETIENSINGLIDELVRLPSAREQREAFARWFEERECRVNLRQGFPFLMSALAVRWPKWTDIFPRTRKRLRDEFEESVARKLHLQSRVPTVNTSAATHRVLSDAYAWADRVAIWCAQIFRGAFIMNFLFAALAVVAASAGVMFVEAPGHVIPWWRDISAVIVLAEIVLIVSVILNTWLGYQWRWHRRWVEAREVAERLRIALPLWTLGLRPGAFPGEEATWTGWYVRAFARMQGLRSGDFSAPQFDAARAVLLSVLNDQCKYNANNAQRMGKLESHLEWTGLALFLFTLLVAADHFLTPILSHASSYVVAGLLGLIGKQDLAHTVVVGLGAAL